MKTIDAALVEELKKQALSSPRLRANHNLHETYADTTSRFLNVGTENTYWVPHVHKNPDKWETATLLEGRLGILKFDEDGNVLEKIVLDGKTNLIAEVEPREWHAFVPLSPLVVVFETKQGPYDPATDKKFAPWAPAEDSKEGQAYMQQLKRHFA